MIEMFKDGMSWTIPNDTYCSVEGKLFLEMGEPQLPYFIVARAFREYAEGKAKPHYPLPAIAYHVERFPFNMTALCQAVSDADGWKWKVHAVYE